MVEPTDPEDSADEDEDESADEEEDVEEEYEEDEYTGLADGEDEELIA